MQYSDEFMRDYLLGKVVKVDEEAFEKALNQDPELARTLSLQRDILIGIQAGFDQELRAKLRAELDADLQNGPSISESTRVPLWRWASAAAIILGSLGVYFYMTQTSANERLYAAHFEDFPNIVAPGQRGSDAASPAFAAYYSERWSVAIAAFEQLQKEEPAEAYPLFYQAMAEMHLENWDAAIPLFERVRSGQDSRFHQPATWYVALAYLRSDEELKAKLILELLADGNSNYQADAQQILSAFN